MENPESGNQEQDSKGEQSNNLDKAAISAEGGEESNDGNDKDGQAGGNVPPPKEPWFWTRPFWNEGKRIALSLTFDFFLLVATCAYTYYASKQWKAMNGQLEQMKQSGTQTGQLIFLYRQQVSKLDEQLTEMHKLVAATDTQAGAARSASQTAHESLVSTQRAMVDILPEPEIVWYGQHGDVGFPVVNNGLTRAKGLRSRDNSQFFPDSDMPVDFQFPDSNYPANPIVLGPKAKISTKLRPILLTELQVLRSKPNSHFYIWGWARYHDIFKSTPEHIDKFCFELHFVGTDQVRAGLCGRHNCVDEECKEQ